jgi:hypothetical protein
MTLKLVGSMAASRANIGMVFPTHNGRVIDVENIEYEWETDITHDLVKVHLVTEPHAALLYFTARQLPRREHENLVGLPHASR